MPSRMAEVQSAPASTPESYPQIFVTFSTLWITLWITRLGGQYGLLEEAFGPRYFHCVETPKPAAMKPKPTTMFQLPSDSIGSSLSVT